MSPSKKDPRASISRRMEITHTNQNQYKKMPQEKRTNGRKVQTVVSASLHKKLRAKVKKANSSIAQTVRDLIQEYVR